MRAQSVNESDLMRLVCLDGLSKMSESEVIDMLAKLAEESETDEDRDFWRGAMEIYTGPLFAQ